MKWWRRTSREQELQREIESHLQAEADELQERGGDAMNAARRAFGNATLVAEDTRAAWGWASVERLGQDVRYAVRLLGKSWAFTITALLSLAIGIGMNTAMFTLVDAVLLRDLPVQSPDELVVLAERAGTRQVFSFAMTAFNGLKENDTLTGLCAFRPWRFQTTIHGEPQLANGQLVSGDYFSLLGVRAHLGRTLTPDDARTPGASPVAVLSFAYWQREFASDPGVVGRAIDLQGMPFTIVGVTAPEFYGYEPGKTVDITVPLTMQPVVMPGTALLSSSTARWLRVIGRRRAGTPLAQAQANLATRWAQLLAATPQRRGAPESRLEVLPGGQGLYDLRRQFSMPLRVLLAVVALVLLVACANLASLLLARATARRQEIALRMSLGATRGRLLRQLLTESALLALVGGACGIALAYWGCQVLVAIMSQGRGLIVLDLAIHGRTLAFTAIISMVTGLLFGIVPAMGATNPEFAHGARTAGARRARWTSALVISQVALCLTVLACAGLLLGSLRKLRQVDAGFRSDHVLLMSIRPATSGYHGKSAAQLYADLYDRFSALPGVRSVTLSMDTPLGGVSYTTNASVPGAPPSDVHQINVNTVGPRFLETLGIPLRSGRELTARDDESAPAVAVISESVARELFPGTSALGRRISFGGASMEVVGVSADTRYQSLREAPQPMVYRPYMQMRDTAEQLFFGIRSTGDPESIVALVRRELRAAAPTVPVFTLGTLDSQVDGNLVQERMVSTLAAWFGGFALLLASVGLYGRLAYAVAERTREIGIRLALGATQGAVTWAILRNVVGLVVCGVAIGLPLAMAAARAVASLLFGLTPFDPATLSLVVAAILAVAAVAAYAPTRRATRVDPMVALRYE